MDDELQEVRDNFYAGNFQKALQMCEGTNASSDIAQAELGALTARCCLSIPLFERLRSYQNSEIPGQQASALMAILLKSPKEDQRAKAKEKLIALAQETQDMSSTMLASIAMALDKNWSEAAQTTKSHPTQEMQALCALFCLNCNQAAQAEKIVENMKGNNDDSSAYRLAFAAVKAATGDPEEAYHTYCDLSTQFPPTDGEESGVGSVPLQVGKALANMMRGMFTEALEDLQSAIAVAPSDPDVLANLCCCMTHLGKKDEFQQYYAKLEQVSPQNPYVLKSQSLKSAFTRFKQSTEA